MLQLNGTTKAQLNRYIAIKLVETQIDFRILSKFTKLTFLKLAIETQFAFPLVYS